MGKAESTVVHQLSALLASGSLTGVSDRLLLERFVTQPGEIAEAAFAALVARHGPMVLKVCRTMTTDHQDAQDAFQVTFLVLATKASRLRNKGLLANWLYGVAMRSALRMRANSARRWRHERRVAERSHESVTPVVIDAEDYTALYEEINALPERFRGPVVLCHLEGLTREMAASLLECPVSTLNVRLMRARKRLKERLTRRQLHLPAGLVASMLDVNPTKVGLSAPMGQVAMDAASGKAGTLSSSLIALAKEIQMGMFMTKLKVFAGLLLTISVVTAGVGTVARSQSAVPQVPSDGRDVKTPERIERGNREGQKFAPEIEIGGHLTYRRLDPNEFPNPTGWTWLMWPQGLKGLESGVNWAWPSEDRIVSGYSHIDPTDGSLRIFFVQAGPITMLGRPEHRFVVLDALKNRYLPTRIDHTIGAFRIGRGETKSSLMHVVYRLDRAELDPAKATHIGIEQVAREQDK